MTPAQLHAEQDYAFRLRHAGQPDAADRIIGLVAEIQRLNVELAGKARMVLGDESYDELALRALRTRHPSAIASDLRRIHGGDGYIVYIASPGDRVMVVRQGRDLDDRMETRVFVEVGYAELSAAYGGECAA